MPLFFRFVRRHLLTHSISVSRNPLCFCGLIPYVISVFANPFARLVILNLAPSHTRPHACITRTSTQTQYSVAKLAGLLIKTLAKPLSKRIKKDFSRYETTKNLLTNIGQFHHTMTSYMTIWSAGYRVRSITPLENEKALANGADIFGESFIFGVSGAIVVWEYNKSKESSKKKEAEEKQRLQDEHDLVQTQISSIQEQLSNIQNETKIQKLLIHRLLKQILQEEEEKERRRSSRSGYWPFSG